MSLCLDQADKYVYVIVPNVQRVPIPIEIHDPSCLPELLISQSTHELPDSGLPNALARLIPAIYQEVTFLG